MNVFYRCYPNHEDEKGLFQELQQVFSHNQVPVILVIQGRSPAWGVRAANWVSTQNATVNMTFTPHNYVVLYSATLRVTPTRDERLANCSVWRVNFPDADDSMCIIACNAKDYTEVNETAIRCSSITECMNKSLFMGHINLVTNSDTDLPRRIKYSWYDRVVPSKGMVTALTVANGSVQRYSKTYAIYRFTNAPHVRQLFSVFPLPGYKGIPRVTHGSKVPTTTSLIGVRVNATYVRIPLLPTTTSPDKVAVFPRS